MTNTTLLIKSLLVLTLLVGFAHYISKDIKSNTAQISVVDADKKFDTTGIIAPLESSDRSKKSNKPKPRENSKINQETDYIVGMWKAKYTMEDFKGSVIYDLKKEGTAFLAYTLQYADENGQTQKADMTKTLMIKNFDGYKGTGVYYYDYNGEVYDIPCQIDMVDENTFMLSYEYGEYSDVETWKRLTK